jgi:hypothetical protein
VTRREPVRGHRLYTHVCIASVCFCECACAPTNPLKSLASRGGDSVCPLYPLSGALHLRSA